MTPVTSERRRSFAERLRCEQTWRLRAGDGREYVIHQLHRKDRLAELRLADGGRLFVRFKDLREKWECVI